MNRVRQLVLIASTLLGSWLGMQAIHESGHVLGAWCTGGRVARVVLDPLTISRTDFCENPHPLFAAWAGPIVGAALPLLLSAVAAWARLRTAFVLRFFAGFCLLANGLYIAVGSFDRVGDCGEMLRHGSPIWTLWLFGAATAPLGLWLWHRQGPHFGFGPARGQVDPVAAYGALFTAMSLAILGFVVDGS